MQFLNAFLSVVIDLSREGPQGNRAQNFHRLPELGWDAFSLMWGLYISQRYFQWNSMASFFGHADILALFLMLCGASFVKNQAAMGPGNRAPPGEMFGIIIETAADWMEVWFF